MMLAFLKYKVFGIKSDIEVGEVINLFYQDFFIKHWTEMTQELKNIAVELELDLTEEEIDNIRGFALSLMVWIYNKAWEYDDSDFRIRLYSSILERLKSTDVDFNQLKKTMEYHFAELNEAWEKWQNDSEQGIVFGFKILSIAFDISPKKDLLDPLLSLQITGIVSLYIETMVKIKKEFDKRYNYIDSGA